MKPLFWMTTVGESPTGIIHYTLAAAQNHIDFCVNEKTMAGMTFYIIPLAAMPAAETKTNKGVRNEY